MNLVLLLVIAAVTTCHADVTSFTVTGHTITQEVVYSVPPDTLFQLMTGDIKPWWDHSFSESPVAMYIEAKPGGGFFEIYDDQGNGVRHAVVTACEPGKLLRMEGPLGLAGKAVMCVWTWKFEAAPEGTKLSFTGNMIGQIDPEFEKVVAGVWNHFLVEQLKPYVDGGGWKK